MLKKHTLRQSPCRKPIFVSKGLLLLLLLLDDLMSNVVLLRMILIVPISYCRRNYSRISIKFVLITVSKVNVIYILVNDISLPRISEVLLI